MCDIACVGIFVADVIAKTVDGVPSKGKLSEVNQIEIHSGGCAVNTAIDLAKIGISSAVIGKIGKDGFGDFLLECLKNENVNVEGVVVDEAVSTSASIVLVDSSGERTFLHCYGADGEFTDEDVNYELLNKSKIIFIAGFMLMPKFDGAACARVLKRSKEMGKYTVLDTAWDTKGRWMDALMPSMEYIDLFIPSYEEAVMLSNRKDPEEIADCFMEMGVKTVVIKMGKDGCFIKDKSGEKHSISTYGNIKAVDTTGAGDSFVAGFLTGLIKGMSLYECGKFANAVGTHCVMAVGASTGIKSYEKIEAFIKEYETNYIS